MKKYLLTGLLLVFITNVIPNVSLAWDSGCTAAGPFSSTTGQPCGERKVDCNAGDLFSSVTGQPCSSQVFPPGCTSVLGYSMTTGRKCDGSTPTSRELIRKIDELNTKLDRQITSSPSPSPTPSPVSTKHTVGFLATPTYDKKPAKWTFNGILLQANGYLPTDDITVTLKDGSSVVPLSDRESNETPGNYWFNNSYEIPLSNKTYQFDITINGVKKTMNLNVTTKEDQDHIGIMEDYPLGFPVN